MPKRFVFFYFMKNEPERIQEIVPSHINYWKTSKLEKYLGGPFADRTGGLISFESSRRLSENGFVARPSENFEGKAAAQNDRKRSSSLH